MSKWTDIRDSITSVLKVDDVTEEVKEKSPRPSWTRSCRQSRW